MSKVYKHLMSRVEYPIERGYRMESVELPNWIYLTVEARSDSKVLVVHSRIHMNKRVEMNPCYSKDFSDHEIIKDLSGEISHRFL